MNTKNALNYALGGKKIRRVEWPLKYFLRFSADEGRFVNENGEPAGSFDFTQEDWEVVEEPVSFAVAFEAFFKEQKTIRSLVSDCFYYGDDCDAFDQLFSAKEIADDWVIL